MFIFAVLLPKLCRVSPCNSRRYLSIFFDFQLWLSTKFRLSKIKTLILHQVRHGCQITSKSVKRLLRYGDLTVFKVAAVRYLGFLKFLTVGAVMRPFLRHRTKCRDDRSNRCRDIAIFLVIFKMAAAAILAFQKFEIFTIGPLCVAVRLLRHCAKFH